MNHLSRHHIRSFAVLLLTGSALATQACKTLDQKSANELKESPAPSLDWQLTLLEDDLRVTRLAFGVLEPASADNLKRTRQTCLYKSGIDAKVLVSGASVPKASTYLDSLGKRWRAIDQTLSFGERRGAAEPFISAVIKRAEKCTDRKKLLEAATSAENTSFDYIENKGVTVFLISNVQDQPDSIAFSYRNQNDELEMVHFAHFQGGRIGIRPVETAPDPNEGSISIPRRPSGGNIGSDPIRTK